MSSERLARIRPALQSFIDRNQTPNFVTLVAREGKIVHFESQGYADVASKKPVTPDTIFRLYSDTKPITGAAALILCEEGLLSLNDPVSKYIPAFKNPLVTTRTPDTSRPAGNSQHHACEAGNYNPGLSGKYHRAGDFAAGPALAEFQIPEIYRGIRLGYRRKHRQRAPQELPRKGRSACPDSPQFRARH